MNYWMAGAYWSDSDPIDQTPRFQRDGIWENGYDNNFVDAVKSMQIGDRIAIKAVGTQKLNLPFDSGGRTASKMTIKAVGTITGNIGDGKRVNVDWDKEQNNLVWYFYTARVTLWRLRSEDEYARRLIAFAFDGQPQDLQWFCEKWYHSAAASRNVLTVTPQDASSEIAFTDSAIDKDAKPYDVRDIIDGGTFLPEADLVSILDQWRHKKNLVLQGSPGVGKTFLARSLSYALMGEEAPERVAMVQFHQNFSYDDFVRGYRPRAAGGFEIRDGVFLRFCRKAAADPNPDHQWIFIIDELNRGNLAQVFGELLMLIESDKRGPSHAVSLVYPRTEDETFFIPPSVHIIGLMNIAERSHAIVDYAMRRRFAFVTLDSQYQSPIFYRWLTGHNMDPALVQLIISRMSDLNEQIRRDKLLGIAFEVGHSYFCPRGLDFTNLTRDWYNSIVETEIMPLLREYWFDDTATSDSLREMLLRA